MHWTYCLARRNLNPRDGLSEQGLVYKEKRHEKDSNSHWGIAWNRRSIAKRLAADGFAVVINYAGNTAKAEETVNEITTAGGRALAIRGDVANPEDVNQLFEKTLKSFGQIDVVVNNAGIMPLSPITKGDIDTFDKVIATNLRGTFLVLAQAAQHVAEGGRIIASPAAFLRRTFLPTVRTSLQKLELKV